MVKLVNVGEQAVDEDFDNGSTVVVDTPADNAATSADEAAQIEADVEAAGVNRSAADDKRTKKRARTALLKKIGDIGEAYGAGSTSMIELAEEVTEAAVARTIGPDDAADVYKTFRERASARATIDDAGVVPSAITEETSTTQQESKLRTFIHLGNAMEEALDIVRRARNVHLTMLSGDKRGVKKGSTYVILTGIAREALNEKYAGVPMTDEQIRACLEVPVVETTAPDGAKKIRQALDLAKAARKGSQGNAKGEGVRVPVESPALDEAIRNLYAALGDASAEAQAAYDKEKADAEAAAQAKADAKAAKAAGKKK